MRTKKSDTTTSELLKSSMAPSALSYVFSPYGGNGREAERSLTELAQKKQMGYSIVIHWLRVKLYFNLLRSAVLCLRGSRTTKHELNTDFSKAEIANVIGKIK